MKNHFISYGFLGLIIFVLSTGIIYFKISQRVNTVGIFWAIGLFLFSDYLNLIKNKKSCISEYRKNKLKIVLIFVVGMAIGMIYDFFGVIIFKAWYYPVVKVQNYWIFILPLFWGIFMLLVKNYYDLFRKYARAEISFFMVTVVLFILLEGIAVFSKTWVYVGEFSNPAFLFLGWAQLVFVFVVVYRYIENNLGS